MHCLAQRPRPLLPCMFLRHETVNLVLSTVRHVAAVAMTALTMIRCRNDWPLIQLATLKLIFSFTYNFMTIHAATLIDCRCMKRLHLKAVVCLVGTASTVASGFGL